MANLNLIKCRQIGEFLRPIKITNPVTYCHGNNSEDKLFFLIIFSGICHSINNDFLYNSLAKIQKEHPEKFNPDFMEKITDDELYSWIKDYPKKERIKIEIRAGFVRDICKKLNKIHDGKVFDLLETSNFDVPVIYKSLDIFDAFNEDPLRKKSSIFISELISCSLFKIKNKEKILIMTDYHVMRTILRNGLVNLDASDKKTLMDFDKVDIHFANNIRKLCIDAISEIAKHAYKYPAEIETLYWYIGRSCCDTFNPCCEKCTKLECEIPKTASFRSSCCFLSRVCNSVEDKELRKIREPNFETTFY